MSKCNPAKAWCLKFYYGGGSWLGWSDMFVYKRQLIEKYPNWKDLGDIVRVEIKEIKQPK